MNAKRMTAEKFHFHEAYSIYTGPRLSFFFKLCSRWPTQPLTGYGYAPVAMNWNMHPWSWIFHNIPCRAIIQFHRHRTVLVFFLKQAEIKINELFNNNYWTNKKFRSTCFNSPASNMKIPVKTILDGDRIQHPTTPTKKDREIQKKQQMMRATLARAISVGSIKLFFF